MAAVGTIAVGSILAIALSSGKITPVVKVSDQEIRDGKVVVANATAVAPSWLVIQTETNGTPGPVVGYAKISRGENKDVSVSIDVQKSTPKLFAMIHEDNGEKEKFDFPGNDMPLTVNNRMVSQLFAIK